MSNEPNDQHIENSQSQSEDHSDASLVPNTTDMVSLGKGASDPAVIEPSPKDIVLQRLTPHTSWDELNFKSAASSEEPPLLNDAFKQSELAKKRPLSLTAIVTLSATMGALGCLAATFAVGHFTAPKTDVAEQTRTIESLIAKLNSEVASVKTVTTAQSQKVAKLSETVEKLRTPETTGSITPPAPAAQPNRLPIVEGWTLREASDGMATLLGRDGIYDVQVGDPLPGVGRIDAIRRQDGRWVVVTSRGLIVAR